MSRSPQSDDASTSGLFGCKFWASRYDRFPPSEVFIISICNRVVVHLHLYICIYIIGLMPGRIVYKGHIFNKETANTSHENSAIHRTNFHSTIQVHEYYKTQKKTENTEECVIQILPKSACLSENLHTLSPNLLYGFWFRVTVGDYLLKAAMRTEFWFASADCKRCWYKQIS
jgi:hypothetical protein